MPLSHKRNLHVRNVLNLLKPQLRAKELLSCLCWLTWSEILWKARLWSTDAKAYVLMWLSISFMHGSLSLGLELQKDSNQWVCARVHNIYYSWQSSRQNYSKNNLKCIWSYTRWFNNLYYTLLAKSCVYFVAAKTRWKAASMEIQDALLKVSVSAFQFDNFPSSPHFY